MQEECEKRCREMEREVRKLKTELENAVRQLRQNREHWFQVYGDMEKEQKKVVERKQGEIRRLQKLCEKTAIAYEQMHEKYLEQLHLRYAAESALEEEKGKKQKLRAQLNRDHENSSIPSSKSLRPKKVANSRENGKGCYVYICATPDGKALYFARAKKGHEGVKGTVAEDYQGILVHDHDITFYSYGTDHQECLAHVLQYLKGSMDNEPGRAWNKEMHGLIQEMIHFRNETLLSCNLDPEKISGFEERYLKILETARKEYEDIPANAYYKDGYNLFLRMEKYMQNRFATPVLYKQCEENGTSYVIRLKENGILREKASYLVNELDEITRNNKVDYAVVYDGFMYKASSWAYERRVICKVEKPENQMVYMYTFIVTNMDSSPPI